MAVSVLNNIPSQAAQNQLGITNKNLQKSLFELSSGSRINTGADDAAGLAIADGLHANITALTQSSRNANDGVGELQVADGSLAQVTTLLNRAITLATEAATGTVSDPQRIALDDEYSAIKQEIDRIGAKTNYNGAAVFNAGSLDIFLSDGSATSNSTITVRTGVLSSAGLGLGGPTPAGATLSQAGTLPAATASGTLTQGSTGGAAAAATLTFAAQPTALDTVTVGSSTYTFVAALSGTPTANEVLRGANQAASQANLVAAVNGAAGGGTTYGTPTVANTSASAAVAGATVVFTALASGAAGNTIASTEAGSNTSFGAATFAGGVTGTLAIPSNGDTVSIGGTTYTFRTTLTASTTANEVLIGGSESTALANLAAAVNLGGGGGTTYGSLTVANANVTALAGATSIVFSAKVSGIAGNAITSTSTGTAPGTFGGTTLSGGTAGGGTLGVAAPNDTVSVGATTYTFVSALNGTANQVLIGSTNSASLAHLAAAVNGSAGAGTTYGIGTVANASASATATGTSILFRALAAGIGGNLIASTTTGGGGNTFATATFASGSLGTTNDLLNITDATAALASINISIQTVAALRGTIGATVNRLQSAANVINNQVQNLTGAEDGVRAADIPATVATLAKYSILEQTGISALSQANQQQQLVLKLLQ